jgi:dynein heavy chain
MKAFPNPPEAVLKVGAAVMCLLPPGGKIPKPNQRDWKACKASMGNVDQFLRMFLPEELYNFNYKICFI